MTHDELVDKLLSKLAQLFLYLFPAAFVVGVFMSEVTGHQGWFWTGVGATLGWIVGRFAERAVPLRRLTDEVEQRGTDRPRRRPSRFWRPFP